MDSTLNSCLTESFCLQTHLHKNMHTHTHTQTYTHVLWINSRIFSVCAPRTLCALLAEHVPLHSKSLCKNMSLASGVQIIYDPNSHVFLMFFITLFNDIIRIENVNEIKWLFLPLCWSLEEFYRITTRLVNSYKIEIWHGVSYKLTILRKKIVSSCNLAILSRPGKTLKMWIVILFIQQYDLQTLWTFVIYLPC